jgi:hypothetical protein
LTPIALLHVCQESRQEAKTNYPFRNLGYFQLPGWWVNWGTDIFYLDFSTCVKFNDDFNVAGESRDFIRHLILPSRLFDIHPRYYADTIIFMIFRRVEDITVIMVEGPRTPNVAELITLEEAAERNSVAASIICSSEISRMESRLQEFKRRVGRRWPARPVPEFRLMAMDRVDGVNMGNSLISFRV